MTREANSICLENNWRLLTRRGILGAAVGMLTFIYPGEALTSLAPIFVAYVLIDGIFAITAMARAARSDEPWKGSLVEGIAGIAGAFVMMLVGATPSVMTWSMAFWASVTGFLGILDAMRSTCASEGWLLTLAGVISMRFGVLLTVAPASARLPLTWWMVGNALVIGIFTIIVASRSSGAPGAAGGSRGNRHKPPGSPPSVFRNPG